MIPELEKLPLSAVEQIDVLCDRFEEAWRAGTTARIEDYLGHATGVEQNGLLAALLAVEVELRQRRGEGTTPEAYVLRFPDQAGTIARLFTFET